MMSEDFFRVFASGRKKGYKPHSNMFCGYVEDIILPKRDGKKFPTMKSFLDELMKEEYGHLTTLNGSRNFTDHAVRSIYSYSLSKYKIPVERKVKIPEWKGNKAKGQLKDWITEFSNYEKDDIVKYQNNIYICIESHTADYHFSTNSSKWEKITRKDADEIFQSRLVEDT